MRSKATDGRPLTSSERALVVALGIAMLFLSVLSFISTIAMAIPFNRLVEGLSK
jgi:hypothetical protein